MHRSGRVRSSPCLVRSILDSTKTINPRKNFQFFNRRLMSTSKHSKDLIAKSENLNSGVLLSSGNARVEKSRMGMTSTHLKSCSMSRNANGGFSQLFLQQPPTKGVVFRNFSQTAKPDKSSGSAIATVGKFIGGFSITAFCALYGVALNMIDFPEDMDQETRLLSVGIGVVRFLTAVASASTIAADYKSLEQKSQNMTQEEYAAERKIVHQRSADTLLALFRKLGGIFVKAGQHMASLEHLLPIEYVTTMVALQNEAPSRPFDEIREQIKEELGEFPETLFSEFDQVPIAAASLAQVHRAVTKDGQEVALKVQYPGLDRTCNGDVLTIDVLVKTVGYLFPEFQLQWLSDEFQQNLPFELDFANEGKNGEKTAELFRDNPNVLVPEIRWDLTTKKVLCMDFIRGIKITDVDEMHRQNVNVDRVVATLADVFNTQIFIHGFVHCDPHPGNLMVIPTTPEPTLVILDHGLYRSLTRKFRLDYSHLWQALIFGDQRKLKKYSARLGSDGELYRLLSVILTQRSWDTIEGGLAHAQGGRNSSETKALKAGAQEFLPQISLVLSRCPRQLLLLFKTNDLLRSINKDLSGTINPVNSIAVKSTEAISKDRFRTHGFFTAMILAIRDAIAITFRMFLIAVYQLVTATQVKVKIQQQEKRGLAELAA